MLPGVQTLVQSRPDLQDLSLEQKVKRLQKEHPGLSSGYLQHALEASDLDLSLATALVLSAEDGSPRTPDVEVRPAAAFPPATSHLQPGCGQEGWKYAGHTAGMCMILGGEPHFCDTHALQAMSLLADNLVLLGCWSAARHGCLTFYSATLHYGDQWAAPRWVQAVVR